MRTKLARWYVVLVVRIPGCAEPACVGFGLPRYRAEARAAAIDLASTL